MEIDYGSIYLGKVEIGKWDIVGIRDIITYANIDDKIFKGRLIDNICFNDVDIVKVKKIIEICRLNIDLNTVIEENANNISLGERSKLLLCRALYKNSVVLIIDELLSNIGMDEEKLIVDNIFSEYKEKIVIYTTHRNIERSLFNKILKLKERGEYEILK
jgi:ABC-type transport system involved in cytochrome bd biosynthesis fused ATPase/permease subunit